MNYFVHGIMYPYYFIMATRWKGVVAPYAKYITYLQISQMAVGTLVHVSAAWWIYFPNPELGEPCTMHVGVLYATTFMYVSYLVLFVRFFFQRFSKQKHKAKKVATSHAL